MEETLIPGQFAKLEQQTTHTNRHRDRKHSLITVDDVIDSQYRYNAISPVSKIHKPTGKKQEDRKEQIHNPHARITGNELLIHSKNTDDDKKESSRILPEIMHLLQQM